MIFQSKKKTKNKDLSPKKLSKLEKKEAKRLKKYKKKELARLAKLDRKRYAKLKKDIKNFHASTEWLEVEGVTDDLVVLSNKVAALGFKIIPPEVFSLDERAQARWVERMNIVFNNVDLEVYHVPIDSPIFVDNFINDLRDKIHDDTPQYVRNIIEDEIDNYNMLSVMNPRKEFCFIVKGNPGDRRWLKKVMRFGDLLVTNGFEVYKLNRVDFENIFSYIFDNDMINDFYFATGDFADMGDYVAPYDSMFEDPSKDEKGDTE